LFAFCNEIWIRGTEVVCNLFDGFAHSHFLVVVIAVVACDRTCVVVRDDLFLIVFVFASFVLKFGWMDGLSSMAV